jgi:hypothetical protein
MTEQEYTNLLDHLMTQLREQHMSIATDISRQISRGKTITKKDITDLQEKNIKQSEVGKTQTLPLTSKEALELAIEYLEKVILDVPGYVSRIENVFGPNVSWDIDQSQSVRAIVETERFDLNTIRFDSEEIEKAKTEINKLKNYVKE